MQSYQLNWKDKVKYFDSEEIYKKIAATISQELMNDIRVCKEAEHNATDEAERKTYHEKATQSKSRLPKLIPMACKFVDDKRCAEGALLNGIGMIDIDGLYTTLPQAYWEEKVKKMRSKGKDMYKEMGILGVHITPSYHGLRIFFRCQLNQNLHENMMRMYDALEVEQELRDTKVFNPDRVSFAVPMDYFIHLDDTFFSYEDKAYQERWSIPLQKDAANHSSQKAPKTAQEEKTKEDTPLKFTLGGIHYTEYTEEWIKVKLGGKIPEEGIRNETTYRMAKDFAPVTDYNETLLQHIIPCFNGLSTDERNQCIHSALSHRSQMSPSMREIIQNVRNRHIDNEEIEALQDELEEQLQTTDMETVRRSPAITASCDGLEPGLWMVVIGLVSSIVGFLSTRVRLYIHSAFFHLNNIHFIVGEAGSNKGQMDSLQELWLEEINTQEEVYRQLEQQWENEKREKVNKAEQPKELHLKRRIFSLRSSITKILDRMNNIRGMHGFSYSAEADILAQSIRSSFADLTVIIRAAFDNSSFSQDYKSLNSTNVFIEKVMWNIVMCCTPDVIIRMFRNLTNGSLHRVGIFCTPDNTFSKLKIIAPRSEASKSTIRRVAHLMPLFQGDITLMKLEERCLEWIEQVRRMTAKDNDRVKARMRMRVPVIAMRITCEMMLTELASWLYEQLDDAPTLPEWADGCTTAEQYLCTHEDAAAKWLPQFEEMYLDTFTVIADYLMDNLYHFFGERIRKAYESPDYVTTERKREGKNDNVFDHLPNDFTYQDIHQTTCTCKGEAPTSNALRQMVKNWKKAGLIEKLDNGMFHKLIS